VQLRHDAAARTFSGVFTLDTPRDPKTWPEPAPRPVPKFTMDALALGNVMSVLVKDLLNMIRAYAQQANVTIDGIPDDPNTPIPPDKVMPVLQESAVMIFPKLAPTASTSTK
jgi:hypothetical protein